MMTLATALLRIRYRIGESIPSYWSDSELTSYINDAKDDLFNAILTINKDFFEKSCTITTSTTTNRILLPTDFQGEPREPLNRFFRIRSAWQNKKNLAGNPKNRNVIDLLADKIPMLLECPDNVLLR